MRTIFTISMDDEFQDLKRIAAVGIGSVGCSFVNSLYQMNIRNLETIAVDSDRPSFETIRADKRVLIGASLTNGLGARGNPEIGRRAVEMVYPKIASVLEKFPTAFSEITLHADVIWGARIDLIYVGRMRVIAIMTGIGNQAYPRSPDPFVFLAGQPVLIHTKVLLVVQFTDSLRTHQHHGIKIKINGVYKYFRNNITKLLIVKQ